MTMVLAFVTGQSIKFRYTNHRGDTAIREVRPVLLRWGTSEYYADPQWLLKAFDFGKGAVREFAVRNMEAVAFHTEQAGLPLLSVVKD